MAKRLLEISWGLAWGSQLFPKLLQNGSENGSKIGPKRFRNGTLEASGRSWVALAGPRGPKLDDGKHASSMIGVALGELRLKEEGVWGRTVNRAPR